MMRFYSTTHRFYCGVDLHARTISLHVLDADGRTTLANTIDASPTAFLDAVAPCRDGLVVGCECMFAWYWLADLSRRQLERSDEDPSETNVRPARRARA